MVTPIQISVIGALVGAGGLAVAVYSYYSSQERFETVEDKLDRFEDQLDRKEQLRELADDLKELADILNLIHERRVDPSKDPDVWGQLDFLSKEIVSDSHFDSEIPKVQIGRFDTGSGEEAKEIQSVEQAKDELQNGGSLFLSVTLDPPVKSAHGSRMFYPIGDPLRGLSEAYEINDSIVDKHSEIIEEFEPELIEDIDSLLNNIADRTCEQIIEFSPTEYDPDNYKDLDELSYSILEEIFDYEGIQQDMKELDEIIDKIEQLRQEIVKTSYS